MKHYIIDGNNLIGKIHSLKLLQKKDKQKSREKLAFMIDNFFSRRKAKVSLHFDGFEKDSIKILNAKIIYSNSNTADDKIKIEISGSKNPRNIIVVSSDINIIDFSKACYCSTIKCEDFAARLLKKDEAEDEKKRIDEINNIEEFKKLFGA